MTAKKKKIQKIHDDALPQNINDKMGTPDLGRSFNEAELSPDFPNTFVNDSGDPNQMSRSEEEEIENNTDIDINKANIINDIDALSDDINEDLDRSLRITGNPQEDVLLEKKDD